MKKWFTSDLHFSHRNVIEYCDRPYQNIQEMDEALIKQWNSQVNPEDEVWFLGDFGINKRKCLDQELLSKLNGKKYIIIGNHDSFFVRGHENPVKFEESYRQKFLDAGWEGAYLEHVMDLSNHITVIMTHLPPDNSNDNRYSHFKIYNEPDFIHLHGHLHGHYRKKGNMIDVAFDGDLKLLTEQDIIELIYDEREFIPTRLTTKFNQDTPLMLMPFEEEVKKKNLRKVVSKDNKLALYNYTDHCTYERNWNDITRASRGIIFEKETGKIVALPFPKFHNIGEVEETRLENLPNEQYTVTKKIDGSLGIIYYYNNQWNVATRGSFTSEQAIRGQEILKKYDMSEVPTELTLLVEIIYPENKIVADYGDKEELVLLTAFNIENQKEVTREMQLIRRDTGMPLVEGLLFTIDEMIELQKTLPKNEEGFVVKYESGLRVKIKGQEYLRVHKLISHMTPLAFWNTMENGIVNVDYLEELPEEYRKEADNLVQQLEDKYMDTYNEAYNNFLNVAKKLKLNYLNPNVDDKRVLGIYLKNKKVPHSNVFFHFLNHNISGINKYVMSTIKPKGNII